MVVVGEEAMIVIHLEETHLAMVVVNVEQKTTGHVNVQMLHKATRTVSNVVSRDISHANAHKEEVTNVLTVEKKVTKRENAQISLK